MKNRLVLFIVLAAMIFSLALPASSVQAAGKTATLVDLQFVPIKGWAVVFKITGNWSDADLKGNTLSVGGHTFGLYCNFRDGNHVSCTMESLGQFVGKTATIFFGGQTFSAVVPQRTANNTCPAYSFETEEGWFYIWTDLNTGVDFVEWYYEETVIPSTISCYTDSWSPTDDYEDMEWYEDYVGEEEGPGEEIPPQ